MLQSHVNNSFKEYIEKNTAYKLSEFEEINAIFNTKRKQDTLKHIIGFAKETKVSIKIKLGLSVNCNSKLCCSVKFCFTNITDLKSITDLITKCKDNLFYSEFITFQTGYVTLEEYNLLRCQKLGSAI